MVRQDIIAGLRNAVQRGFTMQQAMQSYINAGYNAQEVQQAAAHLSKGQAPPIQQKGAPVAQQAQQLIQPTTQPTQQMQMTQQPQPGPQPPSGSQQVKPLKDKKKPPKKKGHKGLIITLIIILVLLIAGVSLAILFKDNIITFINDLMSG